jgi:hypothetical protein
VGRKGFVVVGLFGNEWAMEQAVSRLQQAGYTPVVEDRRHLRIRVDRPDPAVKEEVRRLIRAAQGYVERVTDL